MADSLNTATPFVTVVDGCPVPFLTQTDYPPTGGYTAGRFCGPSLFNSSIQCCLPCPIQHWVYSDEFLHKKLPIANWIHVAGFVLCLFLLISFASLPPNKSHRHYLSVGLIVATVMIQLSFIIPLGSTPNLCYNDITPNDMHSETQCAWTGALIQAGGMGITIWIFLRALWIHLRVCWDVVPGPYFFWFSHIFGWGADAVLLAAGLAATGVSDRIGSTCLPNHPHTVADFWAWLIVFSALAVAIQLATSGYCMWVYVRNIVANRSSPVRNTPDRGGAAPASKTRSTTSTKATWQKVRRLLLSQWRSILISVMVITEAGYFTAVFLEEDVLSTSPMTPSKMASLDGWATCLVESGGDKNACLAQAGSLTLRPSTVLASVILVSLIGIEIFLFLIRPSLFTGWLDLLQCGNHRHQPTQDEANMLIVSHRKPSYAVPINEYSPPELSSDLEKGFFDKPGLMQQSQHEKAMPVLPTPAVEDVDPFNRPGLLQQSQHKTATPLLPTPAVEDVDPFDNYMSPTPLAITAPTAETLTTASHTRGAVDMLPDISDTSSPAHSPSAPQRSSTQRRSRFLEARFSRDEPGPLNFDTQASPEQIQTPTASPGLRETASPSPRPVSSPSPTVPRVVVRSPSGSRRNRPLSGLWRSSSSKVRRETAIDLKAGRGGKRRAGFESCGETQ